MSGKKKILFEFDFPLALFQQNINQNWNGTFNQSQTDIRQVSHELNIQVFPQIYSDFKINNKFHLIGEYSYEVKNRQLNNFQESLDSLFNTQLFQLHQSQFLSQQSNNFNLDFRYNVKSSRLGIDFQLVNQSNQLKLSTTPFTPSLFNGNNSFTSRTNSIVPYWRFKNKTWLINSHFKLTNYQFNLDGNKTSTTRFKP